MASTRALGGWVRIGVRSDAILLLFAFVISGGFAVVLFGVPLTRLVELVTGQPQNFFHIVLWATGVIFVIIAPLFLFMTARPLTVDLDRRVMRVGWCTVPFDQLRYAYRRPGGSVGGYGEQWILQLEVTRGLDARLPMVTAAQADLNVRELETLLAVLEEAPIQPKAGETLRAPLDVELGDRSISEQAADRVSLAIMPHTRVAFAKPTLILEVRKRLESAREHEEIEGVPGEGSREVSRVFAALLKAMNQSSRGGARGMILPPEPVRGDGRGAGSAKNYPRAPLRRGMLGTCSPVFRRERNAVEGWLRTEDAASVPLFMTSRLLGWAIFLFALPLPWLAPSVVTAMIWPFLLWSGMLLTHRARVNRYVAVRAASVGVLQAGKPIPPFVSEFFAPRFPERSYGKHVYALGVGVTVLLLLPILVFTLTGSFSVMANWASSEQEGEKAYFGIVLTLAVLCIALMVRWNHTIIRALARARAEWRLLGGE